MGEMETGSSAKLGFGLMRLPKHDGGAIDIEKTKELVDRFLGAGLTYFDTAYVYTGSEDAAREALVSRHPRSSFQLASKINAWMGCTDEASCRRQLDVSLERTQAGYFDYYLLHALQESNVELYDAYHIWDFVREKKAEGLLRSIGFSFHGTPELLERLLEEHPETDFVQLQINYADWDNPAVASRACYEIARRFEKPIIVMEPVKGGMLAAPPQEIADILHEAEPDASLASWAIRYAASLDGVLCVLSGMSDMAQMEDNLSYMRHFAPLDACERAAVARAQEALGRIDQVPCTGCGYCKPGCPLGIQIPEIFSALNRELVWHQSGRAEAAFASATTGHPSASACIGCGQCVSACPQQIDCISWLARAADVLESRS